MRVLSCSSSLLRFNGISSLSTTPVYTNTYTLLYCNTTSIYNQQRIRKETDKETHQRADVRGKMKGDIKMGTAEEVLSKD